MVLEKTPESFLDYKEIKPVNPKGNQPWIFIGRTDAEARAPVLWPPDAKSRLIGKDPDAGKDWGQEEKGAAENGMVRWHHLCNGHELGQTSGDGEEQGGVACCSPWGHKEWDTTGQLDTTTKWKALPEFYIRVCSVTWEVLGFALIQTRASSWAVTPGPWEALNVMFFSRAAFLSMAAGVGGDPSAFFSAWASETTLDGEQSEFPFYCEHSWASAGVLTWPSLPEVGWEAPGEDRKLRRPCFQLRRKFLVSALLCGHVFMEFCVSSRCLGECLSNVTVRRPPRQRQLWHYFTQ